MTLRQMGVHGTVVAGLAALVFPGNPGDWGVQKGPHLALAQGPIGGGKAVEPLGRSRSSGGFSVEILARHPDGRGKMKLEVEVCPSGAAWTDATCTSDITSDWTDVGPGGVTLRHDFSGLVDGALYRWRARLLRAKHSTTAPGIIEPAHPARGRWLRCRR